MCFYKGVGVVVRVVEPWLVLDVITQQGCVVNVWYLLFTFNWFVSEFTVRGSRSLAVVEGTRYTRLHQRRRTCSRRRAASQIRLGVSCRNCRSCRLWCVVWSPDRKPHPREGQRLFLFAIPRKSFLLVVYRHVYVSGYKCSVPMVC